MSYRSLEPVSKQLTIVVGLTVVGFMAFGLALSFYRNILFDETLLTIEQENALLEENIHKSQQSVEYYQSAQYKDKYAKENLGRLNAGEKILIITQEQASALHTSLDDTLSQDIRTAAFDEHLRQMPVYLHWKLYLFEREELEGLKRGL